MNSMHIISTTDRINGFNITDPPIHHHIVEGDSTNDLAIHLQTDSSLQTCRKIPVEQPERYLSRTLSNQAEDYSG